VLADKETADLLHIPSGAPSFRVKTVAFLHDDTPVEYSEGVYRNDLAAQLFFGILFPKDRNES
jgi:DNA-binding GntR family transcriptional regulator